VPLDVSILADWVGASAAALMPLVEAIRGHVFAAERIHACAERRRRADDTTVPVLDPSASGRHRQDAHRAAWTYVRDDRPFAGADPPAAYFYSPDRGGMHPEAHLASCARLMQGRRLCRLQPPVRGRASRDRSSRRCAGPLRGASSSTSRGSSRRQSPSRRLARTVALFAIKRESNGKPPAERRRVRNWTFAGSDAGGRRAAAIYTLIETGKLNDVDPQAWLTDVLARLPDHPVRRIAELMPWNWKRQPPQRAAV
jgi:transposase